MSTTINSLTFRRVAFINVKPGMELFRMDSTNGGTPVPMGTVDEIESDIIGTKWIQTDLATMTRKGWMSRSLWRLA